MTDTAAPFDEWAILELMGHRRVAGRVREVQLAGAGFLRLDMPASGKHPAQTQYIAPGSVYALHPTTEEIATRAAAGFRHEPISRWEMAAIDPPPAASADPDEDDQDDQDDDTGEGCVNYLDDGPF